MANNIRNKFYGVRRAVVAVGIVACSAFSVSCSTDRYLKVDDPDLVKPEDLQTAAGADAVRLGAMRRWVLTTAGPNSNGNESTWLFGGLLADEWATTSTFVENDQADLRAVGAENPTVRNAFRSLHRVRTASAQAIPLMQKFNPAQVTQIAELYLAIAFSEMQLAADFCNGIPLSNAATATGDIEFGNPLSGDSVFKLAVVNADSGIALATATDAQTVEVLNALKVIKARAQQGANQIAAAATTVAGIPTTFAYNHTYSTTAGDNGIWGQPMSNRRYNVGDNIEGNARNIVVANAINFFSAADPRLPASYTLTGTRPDTAKSQDGITNSRTTTLYLRGTSVAVANGIDARLIEAEAALALGTPAGATSMMNILNALRGAARTLGTVTTPVMTPLADPGTAAGRLDLLFREKAFWTFTRGQRLGDMRRLIRQYGRAANTVFPEGVHYRGGVYGTQVNLIIPQAEQNNPNYKGCTDLNA